MILDVLNARYGCVGGFGRFANALALDAEDIRRYASVFLYGGRQAGDVMPQLVNLGYEGVGMVLGLEEMLLILAAEEEELFFVCMLLFLGFRSICTI